MEEKTQIRKKILSARDGLALEAKESADRAIMDSLFAQPEFQRAGLIMFFASFRSEPDTLAMITGAISLGKRVALPKAKAKTYEMVLYEINSIKELAPGYMGIPEPAAESGRLTAPSAVEMIVMPGVAFDPQGGRLGYGGGFYDTFVNALSPRPPLVAIAYNLQVVDKVPMTREDARIDKIVTERRVITVSHSNL